MPYLLIVNERAGGQKSACVLDWARRHQLDSCTLECFLAQSTHYLDLNKQDACLRLLVVGGDGTFRALIAYLAQYPRPKPVELILLPGGTGNDLARSLSLAMLDFKQGLAQFDRWQPVLFAPWSLGEHLFVNYLDVGFLARVLRRVHDWRQRVRPVGRWRIRYAYACSFIMLFVSKNRRFHLTVGAQSMPVLGFIVLNALSYGGGMLRVAGEGVRVLWLRSRWDMMKLLFRVAVRRPVRASLTLKAGDRVMIEPSQVALLHAQVDGEPCLLKGHDYTLNSQPKVTIRLPCVD
jgi:diacylglycerol kinase family enzyme